VKRCLFCETSFASEGWECPGCGRSPERRGPFPLFAPSLLEETGRDADYAHDAIAAAELRHFWFRSRRRLVVWALRRYFPSAASVLEIGCGTGFVLEGVREAFPGWRLAGTDALVASLERTAPRLPGTALYQMDARRLPFREEFDVVVALDVIEHVDEDREVLGEFFRALPPGGGVLLTVPQHPWLWSPLDDWSHHRRRYTRGELTEKLGRAGFRLERATSFSSLILPFLIAARKRPVGDRFDPLQELRIPGALNALLKMPAALERGLIRAGMSFPAGGSLLVVARRPA